MRLNKVDYIKSLNALTSDYHSTDYKRLMALINFHYVYAEKHEEMILHLRKQCRKLARSEENKVKHYNAAAFMKWLLGESYRSVER